MTTALIACYRPNDLQRQRIWQWARSWWDEYEIFEHSGTGTNFRATGRNMAAHSAGDWDVGIVVDADTVADRATVRQAVDLAHEGTAYIVPHHEYARLGPKKTDAVLENQLDPLVVEPDEVHSIEAHCGVLVIRRDAWDAVGGYDERFREWGYEDLAFGAACSTMFGVTRLPGRAVHLWHSRIGSTRDHPFWDVNGLLWARYVKASGNPEAMRKLVARTRL